METQLSLTEEFTEAIALVAMACTLILAHLPSQAEMQSMHARRQATDDSLIRDEFRKNGIEVVSPRESPLPMARNVQCYDVRQGENSFPACGATRWTETHIHVKLARLVANPAAPCFAPIGDDSFRRHRPFENIFAFTAQF